MSFVEGTPIFTNSGWKNIEQISGHDKVLVRNFIGDAEFMQPYALKKRQYHGEIIKIGASNWSFSVTPEHIVVYDRDDIPVGSNFVYEAAENVKVHKNNRIYRKFKYLAPEEYKRETIVIKDEFGKRWISISNDDWYVLVAFVLSRGYFEKAARRKRVLNIYLDKDKRDKELPIISDILDRIGVDWSLIPSYTDDRWSVRVKVNNSLASRLTARLGSKQRKEMFLPDAMIYNASKDLAHEFIDTMIELSKKPTTKMPLTYQFTTNNEKLIGSMLLMGTIWGYGMTSTLVAKKGVDVGRGELKKDVFRLNITNLAKTYSPTRTEKLDYDGYVYSIDLFDGQVYVKDGSVPVWVNPK